jgi:hypothetical protein
MITIPDGLCPRMRLISLYCGPLAIGDRKMAEKLKIGMNDFEMSARLAVVERSVTTGPKRAG